MLTCTALLGYFLLLPPAEVCRDNAETAYRYYEAFQGAGESEARKRIWQNLLQTHYAPSYAAAATFLEEAVYLLRYCDPNEPMIHGWPAPFRVSIVPRAP